MSANKGKLRSSSKIVDLDSEESPRLSAPSTLTPMVEYETIGWGEVIRGWAKSIVIFLLLAAVLVVGIYAGLAATIAYSTSTPGSGQFFVARGTYVGGTVPQDSTIYVSTSNVVSNSFLTNLQEGFSGLPNGAVVKTIAGPVEEIIVDNYGNASVGGDDIAGVLPAEFAQGGYLKNQYLVECVSGACTAGDLLVINQNQISGEVINQLGK